MLHNVMRSHRFVIGISTQTECRLIIVSIPDEKKETNSRGFRQRDKDLSLCVIERDR